MHSQKVPFVGGTILTRWHHFDQAFACLSSSFPQIGGGPAFDRFMRLEETQNVVLFSSFVVQIRTNPR